MQYKINTKLTIYANNPCQLARYGWHTLSEKSPNKLIETIQDFIFHREHFYLNLSLPYQIIGIIVGRSFCRILNSKFSLE